MSAVALDPGKEEKFQSYKKSMDELRDKATEAIKLRREISEASSENLDKYVSLVMGDFQKNYGVARDLGYILRDYHLDWSKRQGISARRSATNGYFFPFLCFR
jgi:hypothetical protein